MKSESGYYSCWHNRLQVALFLLAFLTFGIGDAITSAWMVEKRGIMGEGNLIVQYLILNFGTSDFILIKLCVTLLLLLMPFLILDETYYWIISGYLVSFIVAGMLGIILNIQAGRNETLIVSPEQAISLFIILVLILTSIGERIDKQAHLKIRPYFKCILNDIAIILLFIINRFKNKE